MPTPAETLRLPTEYIPAPDQADAETVLPLLARARELSGDCGGYARLVTAAVSAIVTGPRRSIWDAADRRAQLGSQWTSVVQRAAATLPVDSRGEYLISRERELNQVVLSEMLDDANAAADKATAAMRELDQELAAGRRKTAFVGLGDVAPGLLAKVEILEREVRTRPLAQTYDAVDAAMQSDALDDARLLMLASEPYVRERLAMPPPKRQEEARHDRTPDTRTGAIDKENAVGSALLALFEDLRAMLTAPSLILASEVFRSCLCPALRFYTGYGSTWDLPKAQSESLSGKLPSWDVRLDNWLLKFSPYGRSDFASTDSVTLAKRGGASGPPGWSPKRRTSEGWQRLSLKNLVANPPLPAKLK
jgi:hypothetical protein